MPSTYTITIHEVVVPKYLSLVRYCSYVLWSPPVPVELHTIPDVVFSSQQHLVVVGREGVGVVEAWVSEA